MSDKKPAKKKIDPEAIPKIKPDPNPMVKNKSVKKVVKENPRNENKKAEAKSKT